MKKSEIDVTMPLPTYEELCRYKELYYGLRRGLADCYDLGRFKLNPAEPVRFDYRKAEKIAHEFLPLQNRDSTVVF